MKFNIQAIKKEFNQSLFNTNYKTYLNPLYQAIQPGKSLVEPTGLIVAKKALEHDILSLTIQPDGKWKGFEAGQHIMIGVIIDGKRYNRAFSICSSKVDYSNSKTITVFIQRQKEGIVTNFIHDELNIGERIYLSDAQGDFILSKNKNRHLLLAGGVGITPLLSMLSSYAKEKDLVLLYYAKSNQHINYKELKRLEDNYSSIKIFLLSSKENGRVCQKHLQKHCSDFSEREILICGPEAFTEKANSILSSAHIPQERIKQEFFKKVMHHGKVKTVSVQFKSRPYDNIIINTDKTLLEALEDQNINMKYGCRMGICNECQCEKEYGQVYNLSTKKISDNSISKIQPCISVPIGDIKLNI